MPESVYPKFTDISGVSVVGLTKFHLDDQGEHAVLALQGDWTIDTIGPLDVDLRHLVLPGKPIRIDVSELGQIDTAGAFVVDRTLRSCETAREEFILIGDHSQAEALLGLVRDASDPCEATPHRRYTIIDLLARVGEGVIDFLDEAVQTLSFIGQVVVATVKLILQPHKIRWTSVVAVMEEAGLDALPIVCFLSFFVGMVIAFIGATMLEQTVGATVFTVELVGWAVMREFGVVLTGILLAGRTNSSFTAQIGSMQMRQEIDAMRTFGLDPIEVLVVPRVLAMLFMTPFLTFGATLSGLFGGLVISWLALDISPILFITRLQEFVPIQNFWVGMSKAPVFAMIVAIIACRQGLQVKGDVQSLGNATTASVVHAIFLIIVADAVFAMMYMELNI